MQWPQGLLWLTCSPLRDIRNVCPSVSLAGCAGVKLSFFLPSSVGPCGKAHPVKRPTPVHQQPQFLVTQVNVVQQIAGVSVAKCLFEYLSQPVGNSSLPAGAASMLLGINLKYPQLRLAQRRTACRRAGLVLCKAGKYTGKSHLSGDCALLEWLLSPLTQASRRPCVLMALSLCLSVCVWSCLCSAAVRFKVVTLYL